MMIFSMCICIVQINVQFTLIYGIFELEKKTLVKIYYQIICVKASWKLVLYRYILIEPRKTKLGLMELTQNV